MEAGILRRVKNGVQYEAGMEVGIFIEGQEWGSVGGRGGGVDFY